MCTRPFGSVQNCWSVYCVCVCIHSSASFACVHGALYSVFRICYIRVSVCKFFFSYACTRIHVKCMLFIFNFSSLSCYEVSIYLHKYTHTQHSLGTRLFNFFSFIRRKNVCPFSLLFTLNSLAWFSCIPARCSMLGLPLLVAAEEQI